MYSATVLYTLAIYRQKDMLREIETTKQLRQHLEIKKSNHRKNVPGPIQYWNRSKSK
jgi:hypothetical protein